MSKNKILYFIFLYIYLFFEDYFWRLGVKTNNTNIYDKYYNIYTIIYTINKIISK